VVDDEQSAWCAGFWDGAGTVSVATNRNSMILSAHSPFGDLLARFLEYAGAGRSHVIHRPGRSSHVLRVQGPVVQDVAETCWPWLSQTKRAQFMSAYAQHLAGRRRHGRYRDYAEFLPHHRQRSRETELAWAAGFWDAAGSVRRSRVRNHLILSASRSGVDSLSVLRRFSAAIADGNGYIGARDSEGFGPTHVLEICAAPMVSEAVERCSPWLSAARKVEYETSLADRLAEGDRRRVDADHSRSGCLTPEQVAMIRRHCVRARPGQRSENSVHGFAVRYGVSVATVSRVLNWQRYASSNGAS
jgi:hypothetical protein